MSDRALQRQQALAVALRPFGGFVGFYLVGIGGEIVATLAQQDPAALEALR